MAEAAAGLFSLCTFTFVKDKDLPESLVDQLSKTVVEHGGEVVQSKRDGSLDLARITHIISNTIDFPQYYDAAAMMIPIVKHAWIQVSLHKGKQGQIRPYTPDPRMIFSDVTLSCADIPTSDKDAIIGATLAMGGMDSDNVTKLTTHICALSMDHPKCQVVVQKKLKTRIVLPHWFDDCFKLGKRIDEGPYLLPNPKILRENPEDPVQVPSSQHLEGATSPQPNYLPSHKLQSGARPQLDVFKGKKILLSSDLEIRDRLRKVLRDLIVGGGGTIVTSVEECEWFVCQFREGSSYVQASHLGKTVGNLAWLYHLITHNTWTSPFRRLLHYPIPKNGIPGFENLVITVSNYGGEARIYLENLIVAAGATFTKTMKQDNTHLITARDNSEKCEAAMDWNISMINHLWIEESYAKCELQALTVPKYTHFPARTNLGEVIGQTFLDEAKLAEKYYPGAPARPTAASTRKRKIMDAAQDNAAERGPAEGVVIGRQAQKDFDVMKDKEAAHVEKSSSPAARNTKSTPAFATPAPAARARQVGTGKENETPGDAMSVASSSRSAKDKARNRLSDLAPDIALYEKEKKRGIKDGHWGGKRAADQIDKDRQSRATPKKLEEEEEDDEDEDELDEFEMQQPKLKKSRPSLPSVETRIVLTAFKRWVNNKTKEDADRRKLRDLGVAVVQDGQACDYLVAPQMVRTVKFLRNISKGVSVVSSEWIEACLDEKKLLDPSDYVLQDKESEKKFGCRLDRSIEKARKNKGKLLKNVAVYCTSSIKNGPENYRAIAEANGAIFKIYSARSGNTIRETRPDEDPKGAPLEPVYLLSSTSPSEKQLWPRFEAMARKGNMEPRVVASDWLLDVAMRQEARFDEKYLAATFFDS